MTTAELKGWNLGWDDAARYATGTKADRREIRRRIAKSERSYAGFWRTYQRVLAERTEDFGHAIREGRLPRTIRPTRLFALGNREYATD